MNDELIVIEAQEISLGTIRATSPDDLVYRATLIARTLTRVVTDQRLYSNISGKKYVKVEGWNTLGALIGIVPREVEVLEELDGSVQATVELIRVSDGAVVGRGSAVVGMDEPTWSKRPRYARRSMAITRATGKAFRLGFSWIMALAGFEATPAEEMVLDPEWSEQQAEPQKAQQKAKGKPAAKPNGDKRITIPTAIVDAGLAENVSNAAAILNMMPDALRGDVDLALTWARMYRANRDAGMETEEAAAAVNAGE